MARIEQEGVFDPERRIRSPLLGTAVSHLVRDKVPAPEKGRVEKQANILSGERHVEMVLRRDATVVGSHVSKGRKLAVGVSGFAQAEPLLGSGHRVGRFAQELECWQVRQVCKEQDWASKTGDR